jgi:hypothetical protein
MRPDVSSVENLLILSCDGEGMGRGRGGGGDGEGEGGKKQEFLV